MRALPVRHQGYQTLQGRLKRRAFVCLLAGAMVLGRPGPCGGAQPATETAPVQRQALEQRAFALNRKALELCRQGHTEEGIRVMRESLQIREQLYPEDRYPDGNPGLAQSMYNLGAFLNSAGEHQKGLSLCKRALAMCEKLYPRDKYPQGHEQLAFCVADLGRILLNQGQFHSALPLLERGASESHPRAAPFCLDPQTNLGRNRHRLPRPHLRQHHHGVLNHFHSPRKPHPRFRHEFVVEIQVTPKVNP